MSSNEVLPLENPLKVFRFYIYTTLMSLLSLALDYTADAVSGKVGPVKPVNHTSRVAVVTQTDRPKSFLWRCLCCHFALLTFRLFVIGLSQISSFLS